MIQKRTIGIVGTGNVGVAAAYAIFMQGLASEMILVDMRTQRPRFISPVRGERLFPDLSSARHKSYPQ